MEVYERIRELRKNHLRMTQNDFGERLGVSRSVIKNIELNALARPDQKLSLIKLICKEFSVNEDWLLHGKEPIFVEPDEFVLDDFAKQHGATNLELQIVKAYFELEPDIRKMIMDHFRNHLQPSPTTAPEPGVEELEAEYKKSISSSVQNTSSTAMNITEENAKTGTTD